MSKASIKIAMIAGEDSGDLLGAHLIQDLKKINSNISYIGVGGKKMQSQGMELICSNKAFAIMGIAEVLKKLPQLLKMRKRIVADIIKAKPDYFIGIDAPDLNFPIEKQLKKHGIKIIHYVSPSIWAWRPKRAMKISQITDLVLTLFPFEPQYYHKVGGQAEFVGHPLAENIEIAVDKRAAKRAIHLNDDDKVLAVLPGSRSNELKAHTQKFIKTALLLKKQYPDWQIISANTSKEKKRYIQQCADLHGLSLKIYDDATAVLKAADMAILASGTVALEAMLCKTPMVVGYQISAVTHFIIKAFNMMLLPYYSLPNVLFGGFIVPEVLQKNMTPENLYSALLEIIRPEKKQHMLEVFTEMHKNLLSGENTAAQVVNRFIMT